MKRFFTYLLSVASVFAALSCDPIGNTPEGPENGGEGNRPETPQEGVLTIEADKTEIKADGSESVTFTVLFGSEDVSTKKTMHIIKEFDGKTENMANGANVFSTTAPGIYKFTAYLYSDGQHLSENSVTVTATKTESLTSYPQRIIGEQFTSLGCQSCPGLSAEIKKVQKDMPGVLIPISFHMDFSSVADPMTIDATAAFMKYHAFQGLPYFNLNFHKSGGVNASASAIMEAMEEELNNNPATCGVAIDTEYDAASGKLKVVAKITSNTEVRYKYHIFVVEDGITGYDQMGATPSYVHDNVVRVMVAPQVTGFDINNRNPLTPGAEVTAEKTVTIKEGWNVENMRVVVAALTTLDGGATWTCSNANECKIGESVDYFTGGQDNVDIPQLVKHVAVWEFTGAWCTNCPSGYSNMNYVISRNELYKETVHLMAFHSDYSGDDDLALPDNLTDKIMAELEIGGGFPSFITELRTEGGLVDGTAFRNSLVEAVEEYPAHCGVAVLTEHKGNKVEVTARLYSGLSSSYRFAVFVVEDRVKYYQKDGSLTHEEYNHRHVVRKVVSSTYRGDRLGEVAAGNEISKTYSIDIDSAWNLEETYIYVLAINADGHVNNMNYCKVGEKADYNRL